MFLWLTLKRIAVLDFLVGIRNEGKQNDWQLQETSSALEQSCVALQIAFFVKHTYK